MLLFAAYKQSKSLSCLTRARTTVALGKQQARERVGEKVGECCTGDNGINDVSVHNVRLTHALCFNLYGIGGGGSFSTASARRMAGGVAGVLEPLFGLQCSWLENGAVV